MSVGHIPERDYDGRVIIHDTPRYRGTTTCFSSEDDSMADDSAIWGGSNRLELNHQLLDPTTQTLYMDFNTIDNKTYVLSGLMQWKGCDFDRWSMSIVCQTTATSAGVNTNYTIYGGYLIIPAAGDGDTTVNAADMKLVQLTRDEFGNPEGAAYWNADYNTTTKQFENITAAPNGDGEFNMFSVEVEFYRFVNKMVMLGDGDGTLSSYDAAQFGHNMRMKFTFETVGVDHSWQFTGCIIMFRRKTI